MISGKKILAIIPAREGSKRLPGKNIKLLGGKPLISWTIEAALNCEYLDDVIVSTDSEKISVVARESGAQVPFQRPESLARDNSSSIDVILHTLGYFSGKGLIFDYVALLQPTSPLRNSKHISEAIELLISKKGDAIVSVCETEHSPLWSNTLKEDCSMDSFLADTLKNKRSQDLPTYYRLNGAIYLVDVKRLKDENSIFLSNNVYAYKMNRHSSVDIDEKLDFDIADTILNNLS